jgi:hypothetical protein
MTMPDLAAITAACKQALASSDRHNAWQTTYCEVVDPASVLKLVSHFQANTDETLSGQRAALVKLVRDLTGYMKLATGDKPDPVREDLLLQAKELIDQVEQ